MTHNFPRGADWAKWDLHVHTPASIVNGYGGDTDANWERFLNELEALPPEMSVIGVNDYWFLDGYKKIEAARAAGRLSNLDAVFPVVEMRIEQFGGVDGKLSRVNVHVIFDPDLGSTVIEQQFLNALSAKFKLSSELPSDMWSGAITRESLADLGRAVRASMPKDKQDDSVSDLEAGFNNINVSFEKIQELLEGSYLQKRTLIGIGKTEWADIKWSSQSVASKKNIISSADLLFTAFQDSSAWPKAVEVLRAQNVNDRLLDCSDSHYWSDSKESMRIGNCNTWINSTPTFVGLVHALNEFDHRVFVGLEPPARIRMNENPERFIEQFDVSTDDAKKHQAFSYSLPLNPGFVAVVGNKGQGKSALLDMIALAGNSSRNDEFAFLTSKRFLSGGGKSASHYSARLEWTGGAVREVYLNALHDRSSSVLVEYLPQAYVERICTTDPSTGDADEFEAELREILFTHISDEDRAGERSFDDLLARKTRSAQEVVDRLRIGLKPLVRAYASAAEFRAENLISDVDSKLAQKQRELDAALSDLAIAKAELKTLDDQSADNGNYEALRKDAEGLQKRIDDLVASKVPVDRGIAEFEQGLLSAEYLSQRAQTLVDDVAEINQEAAELFGEGAPTPPGPFVTVTVDTEQRTQWQERGNASQAARRQTIIDVDKQIESLRAELAVLTAGMTAADSRRELARQRVLQIEERIRLIQGAADDPESLFGLDALRVRVIAAPTELTNAKTALIEQVRLILEALDGQLASVASLYRPASEFIEGSETIGKASLEFKAGLQVMPSWYNLQSQLDGRKSPGMGAWMSDLPSRVEEIEWLPLRDELWEFLERLESERSELGGDFRDPASGLRSGVTIDAFLTDVFDLAWVEVRFGLTGDGLPLAQLSPGQRGLVLALFYLVVDRRTTPLLLDQPEENLDNETITSLLVPAIREAAGRRQTIVVTHNPNLAIVGDADQIIHCRLKDKVFSIESGAISEVDVAHFSVNILEGTKPAFDTRKRIYDSFPTL